MNASPALPAAAQLCAALHTRVQGPFATALADWHDRAALAGQLAGSQLAAAVQAHGQAPQACYLSSTLFDLSLTSSAAAVSRFQQAFEAASGLPLKGWVNAYLCAGWGFVLRHALRHTAQHRIALCIVDLDLHDMAWLQEHPVIGRSGFGFSTLLFELPPSRTALPHCGGPHANSAWTEFVMAVLAHRRRHGWQPTFLPYTQAALHGVAQRVLGPETVAVNRYSELGHCFGSDPWIGIVEWLAERPAGAVPAANQTLSVLVGAVGFNGYFTLAGLNLAPTMPALFQVLDGRDLGRAEFDRSSFFPTGGARQAPPPPHQAHGDLLP